MNLHGCPFLISLSLALGMLAAPASAQADQHTTTPAYEQHRGQPPSDPNSHPVRGGFLPRSLMDNVVSDPTRYRVRPAPPGYQWVHVGHDLFLVQDRSGLIVDLVEGGYN